MACIGSAVGMGNIRCFYQSFCMEGIVSDPVFYFCGTDRIYRVIGEMSFGVEHVPALLMLFFGLACEPKRQEETGRNLGWIPVAGALAMAIGYTVVMGWIFRYMIGTFTGSTPGSCRY